MHAEMEFEKQVVANFFLLTFCTKYFDSLIQLYKADYSL